MMNIKPPWWWIVLFFLFMLPILPLFLLNKLTRERIKPLDWVVEFWLDRVIGWLI